MDVECAVLAKMGWTAKPDVFGLVQRLEILPDVIEIMDMAHAQGRT